MNKAASRMLTVTILLLIANSALGHTASSDHGGGFVSGFTHPLLGWDHVVAMIAVGLWGAFLGRPAIWLLPVVFPLVMALGGAIGVVGIGIPFVETGIAVSAVVLGAMVLFAVRPPIWVAAVIVGVFAIFHGHAHGTELPGGASALAYSFGFVVATGLLHLLGILFGMLLHWPAGKLLVRIGGAVIIAVGLAFLLGLL